MAETPRKKPNKPHASFPLTAHPNGQWCKKIRGKVHFFGVWSDPSAAQTNYLRQAADLHAGRKPASVSSPELSVKEMGNEYLSYQMERASSGQIGLRGFEDCRRVVRQFAKNVGASRAVESLNAADFQRYRRLLVKGGLGGKTGLGVHALARAITIVRGLFKWAVDMGLLERTPRWGKVLGKPNAAEFRRSRAAREREHGKKLFSDEQIRTLLNSAGPQLKAAILLGINGGFGNNDCSALPWAAVDLQRAIIDFERPKTAIRRVVPLWPETVEALRILSASDQLKAANEAAKRLVFRTELGYAIVRQVTKRSESDEIKKVTSIDRLGDWIDDLLIEKKLKRFGLGFYTLRHTFRTWADDTADQHAIHRIMGHSIPGMSGLYIEEISLERLRRVVDHVRARLWPAATSIDMQEQPRTATG